MKPVLSVLLVALISMGLPFSMRAHNDNQLPEKSLKIEPGHEKKMNQEIAGSFITLANSNSSAAPFDNGICLLIVTALGIGLIKVYHKDQKSDTPAAV